MVFAAEARRSVYERRGQRMVSHSTRLRVAARAAVALAAVAGFTALAGSAIAVLFARKIVTPPTSRAQDVRIRAVTESTVTLSATIESMTPGRYGLWFAADSGHARIGEIRDFDAESVTRELIGVDYGDLVAPLRGRLSSWFYLTPDELGVEYSEVAIDTDLGPAPAWLVPARVDDGRWVIQVHGRAVSRPETLRSVPVFLAAGYTSLLVSYRNDGDAPPSLDHRYGLGDTEWRDVEAAMQYALDNGARELILMGWSMGGATVLQALTRARNADRVVGVVLDSPVVDWVTALYHQGAINRLPRLLGVIALSLLSSRWSGVLTGSADPIDLRRLDFVARANELHTPILLLHSEDDDYVPVTASTALAAARPDIVTFEHFTTAGHVRLWNYDSERWNSAIRRWLASLG